MEAKSEIEKVVGFKLPDKPDTGVVINEAMVYEIYRAGIREVVEWMNENVGYNGMTTLDEKWQAQLKSWGIKNE